MTPSATPLPIDDLIQILRTLKVSQLRRQLESDQRDNLDRYLYISNFLRLAKEQP
jgi:hypothetical protein